MYLQYYGFNRAPFDLSPKVDTLFLGETHKEGLAVLKYGVIAEKGFLLLTGGVGTGKTTLINCLAASLEMSEGLCVISNPNLDIAEFYHYFAAKIGLDFDGNKAKFLLSFEDRLRECQENEKKVLLIIDEAHALHIEVLEEIRLLASLSAEHSGILSIFLVGQPELMDRLGEKQLLPLRQRIALRFHLEHLTREDTLQYILFRLNAAGARQGALFTEKAIEEIYQSSAGNPRVINILCDNALLTGYSRNILHIDRDIIRECIENQQLPGDKSFYQLPKKKRFWRRWLFWFLLLLLCLDGVGIWFAYQYGLIDDFWQFVQQLMQKILS